MSKAKPCPRPDCGRPKMKGKQSCVWHWLLRQSSDVQAVHARARLAGWPSDEPLVARVSKDHTPDGERWCAGCQSFIPLFYASGSRCKACISMKAHASRLEKVYGIDEAEHARIWELQAGRCAICRNKPASIRFAVDHDHKTDVVRGILCKRCNHDLLGGAHDSVAMLWRAITYLLFPPAENDLPPIPGEVVAALRAHLEAEQAQAQPKLPPAEEPPF